MPPPDPFGWIAGVDGCRSGWIAVLTRPDGATLRVLHRPRLAELLAEADVVAVDMVIGLPEAAVPGGRACDRAARALLGHPRSSSVFSPPARPALAATTYAEAVARNRASSADRLGLSKQAFNLFPKIRELDALMRAGPSARVVEVHPEVAFAALNGGVALVAGKRTAEGRRQRLALLEAAGFADAAALVEAHRGHGVQRDDLVDACVCCWTARRVAAGTAAHLPPGPPPTDAHGLPMAIWY